MGITKQFCLFVFVIFLALQGWRGIFMNTWHIAKSFIQLKDLQKSESMLFMQNKKMLEELKAFRNNPDLVTALKGSQEFNLVQNPESEIIINFSD